MANNEQILLETLLLQKKNEVAPDTKADEYFNIFSTEQILKDYDLSYEEIIDGIVEGGGDGGIDSIYTFINGELLQEDSNLITLKKDITIDVFLIQSKNTNGFSEDALDKFNSSAIDLLNLSATLKSVKTVYKEKLRTKIKLFRDCYLQHISKFPKLNIKYYYAATGTEVHPNVSRKTETLESTIKSLFSDSIFSFEFITAANLLSLARKEPTKTKNLTLDENPISTKDGGYIALVNLKSYFDFIVDDNKKLVKYFFDANVRDYQGSTAINTEIKETLLNKGEEDFWWLNNGITITSSKATYSGKTLIIEEPQIVNGLQSSFEIYNYFHINNPTTEERKILVRVIAPQNENSRIKVIKSTNSQTTIPLASLRATDEIHRDIEDYFSSRGYYYDRRKNYHKNNGRPIEKIISIQYLAQIITAIILQKPDFSRARPTTLIKDDDEYKKIFSTSYPLEIYLSSTKLLKSIERLMKEESLALTTAQIGDIKYHVLLYATIIKAEKTNYKARDIEGYKLDELDDTQLTTFINAVKTIYDTLGGTNKIAKGTDFVTNIISSATQEIDSKKAIDNGTA
jgi:hypothetical protein